MRHKALLFIVLAVVSAAFTASAAQSRTTRTTAEFHEFLLHVNSDRQIPYNCQTFTWYSPWAECSGKTAGSGYSHSMSETLVRVRWCLPHDQLCDFAARHTMPHGYVRWMLIYNWEGSNTKTNYLIGAVQMPNGPFHVVEGRINGQTIHPDSGNQNRIGTEGGPLALLVAERPRVTEPGNGPTSNAYTFGLVGWLKF